jgi:hypothetical protein
MYTYVQEWLQRVDDLVALGVSEYVDDLAMARLSLRVHDVLDRERLCWVHMELACRRQSRLWVHNGLKLDMAWIGLLRNVYSHSLLELPQILLRLRPLEAA